MDLSIIILTFNEEIHLPRFFNLIKELNAPVFVVDSGSTDNTVKIAEEYGALVKYHKWENNHAKQFNWGLENFPIKTEWVLRIDPDEYMLPELISEIKEKLPKLEKDVNGIIIKRRVYFMNRWIKHGSYYPTYSVRLFRYGYGKVEERWMDEHVKIDRGRTVLFENDLVDHNLNNLTWWINKHNNYATREAIDLLNIKYNFIKNKSIKGSALDTRNNRKRWIKENIYSNIPLFWRPFFYFIYRYIIKFGFLDGIPGLIWHFLQGFWYRFLVDAKIYDIKRRAKNENKTIPQVIKENYGIDIEV